MKQIFNAIGIMFGGFFVLLILARGGVIARIDLNKTAEVGEGMVRGAMDGTKDIQADTFEFRYNPSLSNPE